MGDWGGRGRVGNGPMKDKLEKQEGRWEGRPSPAHQLCPPTVYLQAKGLPPKHELSAVRPSGETVDRRLMVAGNKAPYYCHQ